MHVEVSDSYRIGCGVLMNKGDMQFRNPKRTVNSKQDLSFYEYYAGYTEGFVEDVLEFLGLPQGSIVLDPWNGSGTTTRTANNCGYSSVGFDLNPVMAVVAKANLLDGSVESSLSSIAEDIVAKAKRFRLSNLELSDDPLLVWMTAVTTKAIRRIERALQQLLLPTATYVPIIGLNGLQRISSLTAFYYVALFRVTRNLFRRFRGSNPTWIKKPASVSQILDVEPTVIFNRYLATVEEMLRFLPSLTVRRGPLAIIGVGTSESLPLKDGYIDTVITSPPYCTRIDYAIATQPELAILGYSISDVRRLRMQMIGTPTIKPEVPEPSEQWSEQCTKTLEKVRSHSSKASGTYYYKHYLQYFDSLYNSLHEIDRVLKAQGSCALVVQNSYYKDVEIDLAAIVNSMVEFLEWSLVERVDYGTKRTIAAINSRSNAYMTTGRHTVESIMIFRKGATRDV